jgi:hypothetical protein
MLHSILEAVLRSGTKALAIRETGRLERVYLAPLPELCSPRRLSISVVMPQ